MYARSFGLNSDRQGNGGRTRNKNKYTYSNTKKIALCVALKLNFRWLKTFTVPCDNYLQFKFFNILFMLSIENEMIGK